MKKVFLLILFLFQMPLFAGYVDIDIPEISVSDNGKEVVPAIDGYDLDGTGEKIILPYKKFTFAAGVLKVEALKKREIKFERPLQKGKPLYRLDSSYKVKPVMKSDSVYPTLKSFSFISMPTLRGAAGEFSVRIYPVIPSGDDKVVKIDRVRVYLADGAMQTKAPTKGRDSILIITSEFIKSNSKELGNFIDAKRADGFRVKMVTEEDYGGGDLRGVERALKIRSFLKKVVSDYYFLLIIGNPLPNGNDIPMIVANPNNGEVETAYEDVPTDMFYAEVSEDIDKNNNGIYGEKDDAIELSSEFIVGRIPFYDDVDVVDKILARTIKYIKDKPSGAQYRKKILFPMSIAYYAMQDGQFGMPKMDGAYVAQYLKEKVLDDTFITKLLVEHGGESPSEYSDEDALTYDSMLSNWNDSYGAVYWTGHGMPTYSVRTIWDGDKNGNSYPDSHEMNSFTFVDSEMTKKMNDASPFVFMGSCLNGSVESSGNLAFSVLKNSAVGVVAASQVSYGAIFSNYNLSSQDIFSYGAIFIDAYSNGRFPAQVLQSKKESWSDSSVLATVKYELNYLGDPSLNMNMTECSSDGDCDDGIYCNGTEVCSEGYCEKNADALPCVSDSESACKVSVCDETLKTCTIEDRPDGFYCGESEDLCFSGRLCHAGECVGIGEKVCSDLDSSCSRGVCNSKTGVCETEVINEGGACDDGLFCTENETCSQGVCSGTSIAVPESEPCQRTICDNGSQSFLYLMDSDQNWKGCVSDDGSKGYCYYGLCEVEENSGDGNGSGCSMTVI